ncbi:MAG: hypothetical protein ACR2MQ_07030 [Gemmatimonadaceae bacterium]
MRTFRLLVPFPLALAVASIVISSPAAAQRHGRRSEARTRSHVETVSTPAADTLACDVKDCEADQLDQPDQMGQSDDYTLSVVSALFPYDDGRTSGPPLLTLVVQNSGSARSPGSTIAVSPRSHLSLVSRLTIPPLAPGEKSVIQIPLEMGPDGAPCIAITISPGMAPSTLSESLRYASAATTIGAPRPPGK